MCVLFPFFCLLSFYYCFSFHLLLLLLTPASIIIRLYTYHSDTSFSPVYINKESPQSCSSPLTLFTHIQTHTETHTNTPCLQHHQTPSAGPWKSPATAPMGTSSPKSTTSSKPPSPTCAASSKPNRTVTCFRATNSHCLITTGAPSLVTRHSGRKSPRKPRSGFGIITKRVQWHNSALLFCFFGGLM